MDDQTITCVTSDKIGETGTISFKFIAEIPDEKLAGVVRLPWGYIWKHASKENTYPFNVFKSGHLVIGGGFDNVDDAEWTKETLDAIPACIVLMSSEVFDWISENIFEQFNRPFVRIHVDKPLLTS